MNVIHKKTVVLVVDDDVDVRERLKNMLERRSYSVLTAGNGLEGLKAVQNNKVDIVFCDISMPEMDGLQFLKKVHEIDLRVEIIMVTGDSSIERCVSSMEENACDYLIKPLRLEEIMANLVKATQRIAEKKQMLKRAFLMEKRKEDERPFKLKFNPGL